MWRKCDFLSWVLGPLHHSPDTCSFPEHNKLDLTVYCMVARGAQSNFLQKSVALTKFWIHEDLYLCVHPHTLNIWLGPLGKGFRVQRFEAKFVLDNKKEQKMELNFQCKQKEPYSDSRSFGSVSLQCIFSHKDENQMISGPDRYCLTFSRTQTVGRWNCVGVIRGATGYSPASARKQRTSAWGQLIVIIDHLISFSRERVSRDVSASVRPSVHARSVRCCATDM